MWITLEDWQCRQLELLSKADAERVETMLNTLWASYPGLLEELAIGAVDQEALSLARCAEILGIGVDDVEARLIAFRRLAVPLDRAVVGAGPGAKGACVSGGQVAVWEIVREYRKLGSLERVRESFPTLSECELAAALEYAMANPAEIQDRIDAFETVLARKRSEYPFAG